MGKTDDGSTRPTPKQRPTLNLNVRATLEPVNFTNAEWRFSSTFNS
jgi:hypothetical protein